MRAVHVTRVWLVYVFEQWSQSAPFSPELNFGGKTVRACSAWVHPTHAVDGERATYVTQFGWCMFLNNGVNPYPFLPSWVFLTHALLPSVEIYVFFFLVFFKQNVFVWCFIEHPAFMRCNSKFCRCKVVDFLVHYVWKCRGWKRIKGALLVTDWLTPWGGQHISAPLTWCHQTHP